MMMEVVVSYASIEYDAELPEKTFALPEAVRKKLEAAKKPSGKKRD